MYIDTVTDTFEDSSGYVEYHNYRKDEYFLTAHLYVLSCEQCKDDDGDGYNGKTDACPEGDDCNDDPTQGGFDIHPDAVETCGDGKDNNCDGQVDEGCCGVTIPNVPTLIRQCDSRWRDLLYDNTSDDIICDWGCALASLNMLMNSKGCYPDFLETNNCASCFDPGGAVNWSRLLNKYCPSIVYFENEKVEYRTFKTVESVLAEKPIDDEIKNGYNYILHVKNKKGKCRHFVLMTGVTDDCGEFNVLDPSNRVTSVSEICGYRKFK